MKTLQFTIAITPILVIALAFFGFLKFEQVFQEYSELKASNNYLLSAISKIKIEKPEPIDLSQLNSKLSEEDKAYMTTLLSRPLRVEMSFDDRQKTTDFLLKLDPAMYKENGGGAGGTSDIKVETPTKTKPTNKINLSAGKDAISK